MTETQAIQKVYDALSKGDEDVLVELIRSLPIVESFEIPFIGSDGEERTDIPPQVKQSFARLPLKKGDLEFTLSMQASEIQSYCSPKKSLPSLMDYDSVEVALLNDSNPDGSGADFLGNEDVGFSMRVQKGDVGGWVPMSTILKDLTDFFKSGGVVDLSRREEKEEGEEKCLIQQ